MNFKWSRRDKIRFNINIIWICLRSVLFHLLHCGDTFLISSLNSFRNEKMLRIFSNRLFFLWVPSSSPCQINNNMNVIFWQTSFEKSIGTGRFNDTICKISGKWVSEFQPKHVLVSKRLRTNPRQEFFINRINSKRASITVDRAIYSDCSRGQNLSTNLGFSETTFCVGFAQNWYG